MRLDARTWSARRSSGLALTVKKGLQKLNDDDFRDHHLYELLREKGPAERIGEDGVPRPDGDHQPYPAGRIPQRRIPATPAARAQARRRRRRSWSSARTRTTT